MAVLDRLGWSSNGRSGFGSQGAVAYCMEGSVEVVLGWLGSGSSGLLWFVTYRQGSDRQLWTGWLRYVELRTGRAVRDCRVVHRIVKACRGLAVVDSLGREWTVKVSRVMAVTDCMVMVCTGRYRSGSRGPEV